MKNSLDSPEKMRLNTNFENINFSNEVSNKNKSSSTNKEDKHVIININSNYNENDKLTPINNENILNNKIIKQTFDSSNDFVINNKKNITFEKENICQFSYLYNNILNEKLMNENKELIETIKNIEKKNKDEIKALKNEIERLKVNHYNKYNNKKESRKILNYNYTETENNIINVFQKLEQKDKEIDEYKKKIQIYKNDLNFAFEDFNSKKRQLEKDIPQLILNLKKIENDCKILKVLFESEKNKNIINNIIINEKNKELKSFHEPIKVKYFNNEKIIKNNINNLININLSKNEIGFEYNNNYGRVGIINYGFNCYMSSIIQILKNIKLFGINILNYDKDDAITKSLRKVLISLYYTNEKYISIKEFKKNFGLLYNKFNGNKQNDSTIFLIYLLQHLNKVFKRDEKHISSIYLFKDLNLNLSEENKLEKFLKKYESDNNSYITDLFNGYQMNKITCLKCEYINSSYQSFIILDLPIINENIIIKSLEDCLNSYLITKDKSNIKGFECPNCGERYLSYLTSLIKLPKILVINLKRVGETTVYYHEIEIPQFINTNLIEKLNLFTKKYELIGFVKHLGNEKNGHNISFTKNLFDNKWYSFNDTFVNEEKDFPSTDKSFLLFYQIVED